MTAPEQGGDGSPLAPEPPPPLPPAWLIDVARSPDVPAEPPLSPPSANGPLPSPGGGRSMLPPDQLPYPVRYEVAYPERLSRWKTFFRLPLLIPVYLFIYLVAFALLPLFVIGWTGVFWRKKYPGWAFAGSSGAVAYLARAAAYGLLQTDKFPSMSYERPDVVLEFAEPPSGQLSRWRVFWWKGILLVPHLVVFYFLQMAASVVTFISWFAILFTGNYPRGMFAFTTGVMRWQYRILAYFVSYNDRYPPYSLSRDAGPASNRTVVWSGIGGGVLACGYVALIAVAIALSSGTDHQPVRYAELQAGRSSLPMIYKQRVGAVSISLARVTDPGDSLVSLIKPGAGERLVVFQWTVRNSSDLDQRIYGPGSFEIKYDDGADASVDAELVTLDGRPAPAVVRSFSTATVQAVFVVPKGASLLSLRMHASWVPTGGLQYDFIP